MKRKSKLALLVLAVSLALNVVLGIALERPDGRGESPGGRTAAAAKHSLPGRSGASGDLSTAGVADARANAALWTRINDEDLGVMADRLRALGLSPRAVRTVLAAVLRSRFDAKRARVLSQHGDAPYWRPSWGPYQDPQIAAQLQPIGREFGALYRKYVDTPEALADDESALAAARDRYGDLPLAQLQRIKAIENGMEDQIEQFGTPHDGASSADWNQRYATAHRDEEAALAQALTPDELETYELHTSVRANALRSQLELFHPTEAEFRTIFDAWHAADQTSAGGTIDFSLAARRTEMTEVAPALAAALGPQRYAEYQFAEKMAQAPDETTRLVARLNLPLTTVTQINAVRDDITARAAAVRNDPQLAPTERDRALAALASEAGTRLTSALGATGYTAYQQVKGAWIAALAPKSAGPGH